MSEEQDFNENESNTENEEHDCFPSSQAGEIMSQEKENETNSGDDAGQSRARDFELEISANDANKQKQRRKRRDPKSELFEAGWRQPNKLAAQFSLFCNVLDGCRDSVCQHRLSIDRLGGFFGVQSQKRTFRVHNAVADFHFLVLIHERLPDIRVVSVLTGGVADERRPIGNRFLSDCFGQVLSGGKDGRGSPDGADRRHVNMFGGKSDERPGRARVRTYVSISGAG